MFLIRFFLYFDIKYLINITIEEQIQELIKRAIIKNK